MKIPHIQDNFNRTLQGSTSKRTKEINVGINKGKIKTSPSNDHTTTKRQLVVNTTLSRQIL